MSFPHWFSEDMEYIDKLREYSYYKLKHALGEKVEKELLVIAEYFLELQKPHVFNPHSTRCVVNENDSSFEEVCNTLDEFNLSGVKQSTVFEFYNKIKFIEKRIKQRSKHHSI